MIDRPDRPKPQVVKERNPWPWLFSAISLALIITCRGYHITQHAEWTEAQALLNQWPYYGMAVLCGALAVFSAKVG